MNKNQKEEYYRGGKVIGIPIFSSEESGGENTGIYVCVTRSPIRTDWSPEFFSFGMVTIKRNYLP